MNVILDIKTIGYYFHCRTNYTILKKIYQNCGRET